MKMEHKDQWEYCPKCGKPIKMYVPKIGWVVPKCECDEKREEQEEAERVQAYRRAEAEAFRRQWAMNGRYDSVTFENSDKSQTSYANRMDWIKKNFCDKSKAWKENGMWLFFYGKAGVGKTHLTACMANDLYKRGEICFATRFNEMADKIRESWRGDEKASNFVRLCYETDFLFIDDIGTERVKNGNDDTWMQDKIFDLIDYRYKLKKVTIFTSNYSLQELRDIQGYNERTISRINEQTNGKQYLIVGRDRRAFEEDDDEN